MRIVFLMLYTDIGGAEMVAFQHALIAKKNDFNFFILCSNKGILYDKMLKEKINIIHCPDLETDKASNVLEEYLKDVDVVYNCNYYAITKYIPALKEKYKFHYLSILHSNINWVFTHTAPYNKITDKYFAINNLIKEGLIRNNYPESKITTIPNSIDVSKVKSTNSIIKENLRNKLGIHEDDLVIGMTTRINSDKNVIDAVRIINLLNKKIPASLVIIGDACYTKESFNYKEQLLKAINKSPYKNKFHLLGKMAPVDVFNWQRCFDIALNVSPSEGTPLTLFEQMASGIYCVYPSIGGIPEVLNGYGSVIPIRQRTLPEEIYKQPCYTDKEIESYVFEISKYSKRYFTEIGMKAREYIIQNRNIELFENDIVKFLNGENMKVSVLMTTYNSNIEFLKKAIESILQQTYTDFEFVIVDDCSSDKNLHTILEKYAKSDERIKLYFKPDNTGLGAVLNYGLKECTGDIIIKMDHDDIAFPELIEKQINYFKKNPEAAVCGVQVKCFGESEHISSHPEILTREYVKNLNGYWIMNHPGVAFKKDIILKIGGYLDEKDISEDFTLWCRLLKAGYVIKNQREVLMNYRVYKENYTATRSRTDKYWDFLKRYKNFQFISEYADKITYHMATIPERIYALKESVNSILPQCDELHIYLNNFKTVPDFLKNTKIKTFLSDEHCGDIGDVGKFYGCESWSGYNFTVDDKIIYPHDYSESTIKKIEQYDRKSIVTYHGRVLHTDRKCNSYYKDFKFIIDYIRQNANDMKLDIPGTGVMAFHGEKIKIDINIFSHTNMTDIFMGLFAKNNSIIIMGLQHPANWLKTSKYFDSKKSICSTFANNDKFQTELTNSIFIK